MPTYKRGGYIKQAIGYFFRQEYPYKELIILDDNPEPVKAFIPQHESINYIRLDRKTPLGMKRNLGVEYARADIIVHWDDDDWSAPWRLSFQVKQLLEEGADICGLNRLLYYDPYRNTAWEYVYPGQRRPWLAGGTLCYTRNCWQSNPFPAVDIGEDTRFIWSLQNRHIQILADNSFYIAIIHRGNTSPKHTESSYWRPCNLKKIKLLLKEDFSFYTDLDSSE